MLNTLIALGAAAAFTYVLFCLIFRPITLAHLIWSLIPTGGFALLLTGTDIATLPASQLAMYFGALLLMIAGCVYNSSSALERKGLGLRRDYAKYVVGLVVIGLVIMWCSSFMPK